MSTKLRLQDVGETLSDIETIETFIQRYPISSLDATSIGSLLRMSHRHDRRQILDVLDSGDEKRALTACIMAGLGTSNARAEVYFLARRPGTRIDAKALLGHVESLVREPSIEVTLVPAMEDFRNVMLESGYELAYENVAMDLEDLAGAVRRRRAIPQAMAWQDMGEANARATYACFSAAFEKEDGVHIPNLEEFCQFVLEADRRPRALMTETGNCAAFARVVWKNQEMRIGEVRVVCRHPDLRSRGFGRLALEEALAMLLNMGAEHAWLEAVSTNPTATRLYHDAGFVTTGKSSVYRKHISQNIHS